MTQYIEIHHTYAYLDKALRIDRYVFIAVYLPKALHIDTHVCIAVYLGRGAGARVYAALQEASRRSLKATSVNGLS